MNEPQYLVNIIKLHKFEKLGGLRMQDILINNCCKRYCIARERKPRHIREIPGLPAKLDLVIYDEHCLQNMNLKDTH